MTLKANAKVLVERLIADSDFRQKISKNAQQTLDEYNIHLSAEQSCRYWNLSIGESHLIMAGIGIRNETEQAIFEVQDNLNKVFTKYFDKNRLKRPESDIIAWRKRIEYRNYFMHGQMRTKMSLFLPFAVELSDGCSVGCWFCGVSADVHKKNYLANQTNKQEFAQIIQYFADIYHDLAKNGFLYFATDPFDNPDYEVFSDIFFEITRSAPAITTAMAEKMPVDKILKLTQKILAQDAPCMRFSVFSIAQLNKIYDLYGIENLVDIPIIPLTHGSLLGLANAGKARTRFNNNKKRGDLELEKLQKFEINHNTICCIAGYLVNAATKKISLIAPIDANENSPDGIEYFATMRYENITQIQEFIAQTRRDFMAIKLSLHHEFQLYDYIKCKTENNIVKCYSDFHELRVFAPNLNHDELLNFVQSCHKPQIMQEIHDKFHAVVEFLWQNGAVKIQ